MRKNNDEKCRGAKQSENSYEMKQKAKKKTSSNIYQEQIR